MSILVTGAAGFIGFHVIKKLLERDEEIIGIDNLNDYYDVNLKLDRLNQLQQNKNFIFKKISIDDYGSMVSLASQNQSIDRIVHLAAQAGVRHSLLRPFNYINSNIVGQQVMIEICRQLNCKHFVYASSSSVYGGNTQVPFSIDDQVDKPISLYAATKKSCELLAHTASHLYRIPTTGLRYFTVYGPWGRPDMAYFSFTKSILENKPIIIFNNGDMKRDFTYIDDIVDGTINALENPPRDDSINAPEKIYNLGNNKPENLMYFISVLENKCGVEAIKNFAAIQPGDVKETYADITESKKDLNFKPTTNIDIGLEKFVKWYRDYYKV